jgi:hypothetical protein
MRFIQDAGKKPPVTIEIDINLEINPLTLLNRRATASHLWSI